jgi:hypothetical protein
MSKPLDLTIIGDQLAGIIFAHPIPSEVVLEVGEVIPGSALP